MKAKVRKLRWRFYRKTGGPRGIGNRCKLYAGCIVCESYRIYDATGRFPSFDEASDATDAYFRANPGSTAEIPWSEVAALSGMLVKENEK